MQILNPNDLFPPSSKEVSLTIGNFDGVHLGHQSVLQQLLSSKAHSVVVTFSNHPASILGKNPPPLLCSLSQRLHLLEQAGVDTTFLLPFTTHLSQLSPKDFIVQLREKIPFTHLILGHDAVIGHQRQGTVEIMTSLAQALGFKLTYVPPCLVNGELVSSTSIRFYIQSGQLDLAAQFLGRRYSFTGVPLKKENGFFLSTEGLCLPPVGRYPVTVSCIEGVEKETAYISSNGITFTTSLPNRELKITF